jgi:hypothetical protein
MYEGFAWSRQKSVSGVLEYKSSSRWSIPSATIASRKSREPRGRRPRWLAGDNERAIAEAQRGLAGARFYFGEAQAIGNGMVKTYVRPDPSGQPAEVGLVMTASSSMNGLPAEDTVPPTMLMLGSEIEHPEFKFALCHLDMARYSHLHWWEWLYRVQPGRRRGIRSRRVVPWRCGSRPSSPRCSHCPRLV